MALKLAGRNPARFEFDDGVSQTVVTIQPDDEPDTVRAKLQRVLDLEEPHVRARIQAAGLVHPNVARQQAPVFTPTDREAMDARLEGVKVMGWNEDAVAEGGLEELPEV